MKTACDLPELPQNRIEIILLEEDSQQRLIGSIYNPPEVIVYHNGLIKEDAIDNHNIIINDWPDPLLIDTLYTLDYHIHLPLLNNIDQDTLHIEYTVREPLDCFPEGELLDSPTKELNFLYVTYNGVIYNESDPKYRIPVRLDRIQ